MKCPYQKNADGEFLGCNTECPACKYKVEEYEITKGRKYPYESEETAIKNGTMWQEKRKRYTILGCKFVDNLIKPTDQSITNVNNVQKSSTSVTIRKSIF